MTTVLSFKCSCCGAVHDGLPFSYGVDAPAYWSDNLASDNGSLLEHEVCVIQGEHYFIRGNVELRVLDAEEVFGWTVWVSLSQQSFHRMVAVWDDPDRANEPPRFGWLSTELPIYPTSTLNIGVNVHTGPLGVRPTIELDPGSNHPLAREQREGVTLERVREIAELMLHPQRES